MVLRKTIEDREWDAFCLTDSGLTAKRTCTEITGGTVEITGGAIEANPAGLGTSWIITTLDIGDTAGLIPSTPLTTRESISIFNSDPVEILYVGPTSGVVTGTSLGNASGWEVGPQETLNLSFKAVVAVYGIAPTGKTIRIKVIEAG